MFRIKPLLKRHSQQNNIDELLLETQQDQATMTTTLYPYSLNKNGSIWGSPFKDKTKKNSHIMEWEATNLKSFSSNRQKLSKTFGNMKEASGMTNKTNQIKSLKQRCFYKDFTFKTVNKQENTLAKALELKILNKKLNPKQEKILEKEYLRWRPETFYNRDSIDSVDSSVQEWIIPMEKVFEVYLEFRKPRVVNELVLEGKITNNIIKPFLMTFHKIQNHIDEIKRHQPGQETKKKGEKIENSLDSRLRSSLLSLFHDLHPRQLLSEELRKQQNQRSQLYLQIYRKYEDNPFYGEENQSEHPQRQNFYSIIEGYEKQEEIKLKIKQQVKQNSTLLYQTSQKTHQQLKEDKQIEQRPEKPEQANIQENETQNKKLICPHQQKNETDLPENNNKSPSMKEKIKNELETLSAATNAILKNRE